MSGVGVKWNYQRFGEVPKSRARIVGWGGHGWPWPDCKGSLKVCQQRERFVLVAVA